MHTHHSLYTKSNYASKCAVAYDQRNSVLVIKYNIQNYSVILMHCVRGECKRVVSASLVNST